jgi:hypothetical protein
MAPFYRKKFQKFCVRGGWCWLLIKHSCRVSGSSVMRPGNYAWHHFSAVIIGKASVVWSESTWALGTGQETSWTCSGSCKPTFFLSYTGSEPSHLIFDSFEVVIQVSHMVRFTDLHGIMTMSAGDVCAIDAVGVTHL